MADCGMKKEVRECLMNELESLIKELEQHETCRPAFEASKVNPNFLGPKQPRFIRDAEHTPIMTHLPIVEVRPTASPKTMKEKSVPNLYRIWFPPSMSTHKYTPWDRPTKAKSIEIRAGQVYDRCDCDCYNGMQDMCDRSACGGCLCLLPKPQCEPASLKALQPSPGDKAAMAAKVIAENKREARPYCCHLPPPPHWKDKPTC